MAEEWRARNERFAIEWDDKEIRIVEASLDCRIAHRLAWNSVRKVTGFTRDCFTVDEVVLHVEGHGGSISMDENMAEFWEFQGECHQHLPGAMQSEEFWKRVVLPPFETCLTTIYEADG